MHKKPLKDALLAAVAEDSFKPSDPGTKPRRRAFGAIVAAALAMSTYGSYYTATSAEVTSKMLAKWNEYMWQNQDGELPPIFKSLREYILTPGGAHVAHAIFAAGAVFLIVTRKDQGLAQPWVQLLQAHACQVQAAEN